MSFRLDREVRLRARPEFIRVQGGGRRVGTPFMTILALPNARSQDRLGIIASRKLGSAVVRNRAKRRLRSLFRELEPDTRTSRGNIGLDIVIVPRRELLLAPFDALRGELARALGRMDRTRRV